MSSYDVFEIQPTLSWLICSCFHSADWWSPAVHLAPAHFLRPVTFLSLNCETHRNQNNAVKIQTGLVFLLSTGCSSQSARKSLLSHPMAASQSRPCLKRLHSWWLLLHSFQKWQWGTNCERPVTFNLNPGV